MITILTTMKPLNKLQYQKKRYDLIMDFIIKSLEYSKYHSPYFLTFTFDDSYLQTSNDVLQNYYLEFIENSSRRNLQHISIFEGSSFNKFDTRKHVHGILLNDPFATNLKYEWPFGFADIRLIENPVNYNVTKVKGYMEKDFDQIENDQLFHTNIRVSH